MDRPGKFAELIAVGGSEGAQGGPNGVGAGRAALKNAVGGVGQHEARAHDGMLAVSTAELR